MPLYSPNIEAYVPLYISPKAFRGTGSGALTRAAITTVLDGTFLVSGSSSAQGITTIPLYAADLDVSGKTTRLKVRLEVNANTVDPAVDFTAGLSDITTTAGGNDAIVVSWGTHLSGSTVLIDNATIATSETEVAASAPFTKPADGLYIVTLTTSGTLATNARVGVSLSLWATHV